MSGIIRSPRRHTHDQLPRAALRDNSLSYRARGVLARLLTNADGYTMTGKDLAREAKEGERAVHAALRELRAAGYVRTVRAQGARGHWTTETFVYETPQPTTAVGFPDLGQPDSGGSDIGGPDAGQPEAGGESSTELRFPQLGRPPLGGPQLGPLPPKSRQKLSNRKSSSSKAEVVPAAAPVGKPEAGNLGDGDTTATEVRKPDFGDVKADQRKTSHQKGRKRLRTHSPTGAVYWLDDEPAELDTLVETFGLAAVKSAVAVLVDKGTDPLHGRLRAALLQNRREQREAEESENRRRRPTAAQRAEDARRAQEAMDAIAAQRDAPEPQRVRETRSVAQILEQWRGA